MNPIYDILMKNNYKESKKLLENFLNQAFDNKSFCPYVLGRGQEGQVFESNFPKTIMIEYNKIPIYFENIVIKEKKLGDRAIQLMGTEDKAEIRESKKYLYLVSSGSNLMSGILNTLMASELFVRGVSPHFVFCGGFTHCDGEYYEFYENLNIPVKVERFLYHDENDRYIWYVNNMFDFGVYLKDRKIKITEQLIDSIIISLLHSYFVIQYNFKCYHFDLHPGNIFIKEFDEKEYFRGQNMKKITYFHYKTRVGKEEFDLYVPNQGFIIKFGDFGISTMNIGKVVSMRQTPDVYRQDIVKKFNPHYPDKVDKFIPEYIYGLRDLFWKFGLTSKLLENLYKQIPVLNIFNDMDIFQNAYEHKKELMNPNEILNTKYFDAYKKAPTGKYNIMTIEYDLSKYKRKI